MSRPIIKIVDLETNQEIEREMNDAEFEQHLKDKADFEARKQAEAEAQIKRQALLDKLGITAEEAKLLLS